MNVINNPFGQPKIDVAELNAIARSFSYALDAVFAHRQRLGIRIDLEWYEPPHRFERPTLKEMVRLRLDCASAHLTTAGKAIAFSQESIGVKDPQFAKALHRFNAAFVASARPDWDLGKVDRITREIEGSARAHETFSGFYRERSGVPPTDYAFDERGSSLFGAYDRLNPLSAARSATYAASRLLQSPIVAINYSELEEYAAHISGEFIKQDPMFASVFLVLETPTFRSQDCAWFMNSYIDQRLAAISILDDAEPMGIVRAYDDDSTTTYGLQPALIDPGLAAAIPGYLLHSEMKLRSVVSPVSPGLHQKALKRRTSTETVYLVSPTSWRENKQRVSSKTESADPTTREAFDRRGTYVRYSLRPEQVLALGFEPKPGTQHFWIGWRRDTRVNDANFKKNHERSIIPDLRIQVRKPIPGRPDLPDEFNVFDVFEESKLPNGDSLFERMGTHVRALEIAPALQRIQSMEQGLGLQL